MELKIIKVSDVQEHEMNPRKTIGRAFDRLVRDIKKGKERNLVKSAIWVVELDKGGYRLMDGHHRLRAFREAGVKECPALVVKESDYDEKEQLADLITMNKQVASFDTYKMAEVLNALGSKGWSNEVIEEALGYEKGEVTKILEAVKIEVPTIDTKGGSEGGSGSSGGTGGNEGGDNEFGGEVLEFLLTQDEILLVDQALSKVIEEDESMSRGRALELLCAEHEAGA